MKANFTVKSIFLSISFCLGIFICKAQWGVGVKLGDPLGVSVKKYSRNNALEFIFGRTHYWGSYNYYNYRFHHDNRYKNSIINNIKNFSTPIAFQLHYLIHKDISQIKELKWYFGFGGQFRYNHYDYSYWDQNGYYHKDERVTDVGIGADGVIGLEYTFKEVPISVALDAVLYMEIFDHPFLFLGQGGLAVRYNF